MRIIQWFGFMGLILSVAATFLGLHLGLDREYTTTYGWVLTTLSLLTIFSGFFQKWTPAVIICMMLLTVASIMFFLICILGWEPVGTLIMTMIFGAIVSVATLGLLGQITFE